MELNFENETQDDSIVNYLSDRIQLIEEEEKPITKVYKLKTNDTYKIIEYFLKLGDRPTNKSFYIVNLNEIEKKVKLWKKNLPRIEPYYAIKSNPDIMILNTLASLGCGFDCASETEINLAIETGVPREKIIFANPVKDKYELEFARKENIDIVTFDSECELDKIKVSHPDANCVIRIVVDDSKSECQFGKKFGCSSEEVKDLLELARVDKLKVTGVSFHVGSNCRGEGQFDSAIKDSREVFRIAKEKGFNMNLLDIGGGFPGNDNKAFEKMSIEINNAIDKYFYDIDDLKIIAEPGRYMCTTSHILVMNIIGIRVKKNDIGEMTYKYTVKESIYGSFNNIKFDHAKPNILAHSERDETKLYDSVIVGRTCDGDDFIADYVKLPKLAVGEWLYVENMGAYTRASLSTFNGFGAPNVYYILTC